MKLIEAADLGIRNVGYYDSYRLQVNANRQVRCDRPMHDAAFFKSGEFLNGL